MVGFILFRIFGFQSALISSAASLIGLGSDMAGSLRLPPMFTGIYGHKPSPRLLSIEGNVNIFVLIRE